MVFAYGRQSLINAPYLLIILPGYTFPPLAVPSRMRGVVNEYIIYYHGTKEGARSF